MGDMTTSPSKMSQAPSQATPTQVSPTPTQVSPTPTPSLTEKLPMNVCLGDSVREVEGFEVHAVDPG